MVAITARFIIEIAGKPEENVQKALERFKEEFEGDKSTFKKLNSCDIEEPEFNEEAGLFSGFLEVDAKFRGLSELLNFIVDFTPSSIEIEDPESFTMDSSELSGILNDVSSMLLKSSIEKQKLKQKLHSVMKENKKN